MHSAEPESTSTPNQRTTATVVIPARFRSTRFPGKPLVDICGSSMIEHVYKTAQATPTVDRVIVATDDERIRRKVIDFGGNCCITLPTHRNGTERLAEVAKDLTSDVIVNVQGDEPLIKSETIQSVLSLLSINSALPMSTAHCAINNPKELSDENTVKVVVNEQGYVLSFSRGPLPGADKHIGIYAYRREFLLLFATLEATPLEKAEGIEGLRALENHFKIKTIKIPYNPVGVDTPEDLERVRQIISAGAS